MIIKAGIGILSVLLAASLGGCANDTSAEGRFAKPSYLGADLMNMGGARSQANRAEPAPVIEPTTSSKVLSAIVFERVTGRTAYPAGRAFTK